MSDTINYKIRFDSNGNAVLDSIAGAATKVQEKISRTQSVCDKFGASFLKLDAVKNAIDGVGQAFTNIMKPGMDVESSLADLSAITGATGQKLDEIEGYARKAAKTFGGSAAQSVESYKLILSKLGPSIADVPTALSAMGESVAVLSKTMGGDSVAAAEVLTTAMNQFQVSLDDPTQASKTMSEMMNIMAAAAKEGSAELPEIKAALEQSGMAAKMAGVSFSEANAAIQVLDKAGKKGAEGGTALRNVMAKLSEGRFMPKDVQESLNAAGVDVLKLGDKSLTLSDRLNMLKPVLSDSALLSKMFGLENANAATALISGTGLMDQYNVAIQGTNTAYDQAATVMDTTAEKMLRMKAQVDDMKIGMFNLAGASYPYIDMLVQSLSIISDLVPALNLMTEAVRFLTSAEKLKAFWTKVSSYFDKESIIGKMALATWTGIVTAATWLFSAANWDLAASFMANPITWIVLGIIALIAVIAYVVYKTDGWGKQWDSVVNFMKFSFQAFVEGIKLYFNTWIEGFMIGLDLIRIGWYKFKDALGIGDSAENKSEIAKIHADIEARKNALAGGAKKVAELANKAKDSLKWELSWDSGKQESAATGALKEKVGGKPVSVKSDPAYAFGSDMNVNPAQDPKYNLIDQLGLGSSSAQAQINPVVLPGADPNAKPPKDDTKSNLKPTTDAISAGGSRSSNTTITIKNLIENIVFDGNLADKRADLEREVTSAVMRILAMAQSTG